MEAGSSRAGRRPTGRAGEVRCRHACIITASANIAVHGVGGDVHRRVESGLGVCMCVLCVRLYYYTLPYDGMSGTVLGRATHTTLFTAPLAYASAARDRHSTEK